MTLAAVLADSTAAPPAAAGAELLALHCTALAAEDGAQLASAHALSPEIRNLARLSLRDDDAVDRIVRRWAAAHAVTLTKTCAVTPQQRAQLRTLQGAQFDRQYLRFNYDAQSTLRRDLLKPEAAVPVNLRRSFGLYASVVAQDEFLSGWCLGHCVWPPEP